MSETHTRKSYGDFDEMFKRVRQKSTSENDRGFSKPKYAAYSNMMVGKKKVQAQKPNKPNARSQSAKRGASPAVYI